MARRQLTVDRHEEIKRRLADGRSLREIATALGCSRRLERQIRDGERLTHETAASPDLWGERNYPGTTLTGMGPGAFRGYLRAPSAGPNADPHLRSCNAVMGYHIHARDGEIGYVQGFLVDDYLWSVRYLIVNTSNCWVGHQVLVSPEWIEGVSWSESKVTIDLDRQAIKDAPSYDEGALIDRDAQLRICNHYGRNGHWQSRRNRAVG